MQACNMRGKAILLNAYDIRPISIFFVPAKEIPYDYRDGKQQRKIIWEQFAGQSWRRAEQLEEVKNSKGFYFDPRCQIKMPSWIKCRVALLVDAAYCASPATGTLQNRKGNFELAFQDYNKRLRPFIEEIQAMAELNVKENFIPGTEEAILKRNALNEFL